MEEKAHRLTQLINHKGVCSPGYTGSVNQDQRSGSRIGIKDHYQGSGLGIGVTGVLQGCYRGVIEVLQGRYRGVTGVLQDSFLLIF